METSTLHFSVPSSIESAWMVCVAMFFFESAVAAEKTMRRVARSMAGVPVMPMGPMLPHPAPVFWAAVPMGVVQRTAPVVASSA